MVLRGRDRLSYSNFCLGYAGGEVRLGEWGVGRESSGSLICWNANLVKSCKASVFTLTSSIMIYSRLSLSRNRRDPLKHFEVSVLRHIRCVVLRKNNSNNQISQMTK